MANCKECKQKRAVEQTNPATITIFEHENALWRAERYIKRLWLALIFSLVVLLVTNLA